MNIIQTGDYIVSHQCCLNFELEEGLDFQKKLAARGSYRPIGHILKENGVLSSECLENALERQRFQALQSSNIFGGLSEKILDRLAAESPLKNYPAGAHIMKQDEPGDHFYLVVSGSARAFRVSSGGSEIPLAEFKPGQGFGEISVLANQVRTAFVEATAPTCVMVFSKKPFLRLCNEYPELSLAVIRELCQRLTSGNLNLDKVSDEELTIRQLFGRFVAPEVRDKILSGQTPLDGETRDVTILFADLRGFTPMIENTPPKEMVNILNTYFTEMTQAILSEGGVVLQYIGDEIEAAFGAPIDLPDHQERAVRAALNMRKRLYTLNLGLVKDGRNPLRHGIGIHSGKVVAANIGSQDRMSYTLVGETVNIASRIQAVNKTSGTDILISDATQQGLKNDYYLKSLQPVSLKGVSRKASLSAIL